MTTTTARASTNAPPSTWGEGIGVSAADGFAMADTSFSARAPSGFDSRAPHHARRLARSSNNAEIKMKQFSLRQSDRHTLPTWQKLMIWAVELAAMKIKIGKADKMGDDYDAARDLLHDTFDILLEVRGGDMMHVTSTICERDGAALRVVADGLVHFAADGTETDIDDEHEIGGGLASITVDGHEWTWGEMADGAVAAVHDLLDRFDELYPESAEAHR